MSEYFEGPFQSYESDEGIMQFTRVCPKCGRFVKPDESVITNGLGQYVSKENATCSKCGRVEMNFQGFF